MFDTKKAETALADFRRLLDATPAEAAHVRIAPDAWTLAEIVGHLIDSAGNNHQRFVRLRFGDLAGFPAYDTEPWV
ncbi:MAG: DinB family protein [Pseudodesulfovibrio sp.]